jgi:hypothetical protein
VPEVFRAMLLQLDEFRVVSPRCGPAGTSLTTRNGGQPVSIQLSPLLIPLSRRLLRAQWASRLRVRDSRRCPQ